MTESMEQETFPFGDDATPITVIVPVLSCSACQFIYTDARAERIRHSAICQHQGLLSPERIKEIRVDIYGMSRKEFETAFGPSQASMERWENGKLFQGEVADGLLRALEDTSVAARINRETARSRAASKEPCGSNVVWGTFPSLSKDKDHLDDAIRRETTFDLRTRANK